MLNLIILIIHINLFIYKIQFKCGDSLCDADIPKEKVTRVSNFPFKIKIMAKAALEKHVTLKWGGGVRYLCQSILEKNSFIQKV